LTWHILVKRPAHWLYGQWQRGPWTRKRIRSFVDDLGIDASEAALPLDAYRSLDDFFVRELRPGVRPLDPHPERLLSPADARVLAYGRIGNHLPTVKGQPVTLATLLGDGDLAASFEEGSALVFRLAPADYHRFHFPASGHAGEARTIEGPLHSVHPIAIAGGAPSFENARIVTRLETVAFGPLLLVEVGALLVGTIRQTFTPGEVRRGQEKGYFRFGGSTVVLLAQRHRILIDDDLLANTRRGFETRLRMGTGIARSTST
jgi:phosphatidylserine decarboxylase